MSEHVAVICHCFNSKTLQQDTHMDMHMILCCCLLSLIGEMCSKMSNIFTIWKSDFDSLVAAVVTCGSLTFQSIHSYVSSTSKVENITSKQTQILIVVCLQGWEIYSNANVSAFHISPPPKMNKLYF